MYDFYKKICEIKELSWHEMLPASEQEARAAEGDAYSGKPGCVKAREDGAIEYVRRMRALAFYLGNQVIPAGATDSDIEIYIEITQILVEKKQFNPQVLALFDGDKA